MGLISIHSFLLTLLFMGCSSDMGTDNDTYLHVNPSFEPITGIFYKGENVYLIGSLGNSNDYSSKQSVFLVKVESGGFKQTGIKIGGETSCYTLISNDVYFVNEQYPEKLSFKNSSSLLYKLNIESLNLDTVCNFGNTLITDVHFKNSLEGYVVARFSNIADNFGLLSTKDGGASWDTLNINHAINQTQIVDDTLVFTSKNSQESNQLFKLNLHTSQISSVQMDMNIKGFKVDDRNRCFLFGEYKNELKLVRQDNKNIEELPLPNYDSGAYPGEFYINENLIVIAISRINNQSLGGFGGTENQLFYTLNNGVVWGEMELPQDHYLSIWNVFQNKSIVAYIGEGELIQHEIK